MNNDLAAFTVLIFIRTIVLYTVFRRIEETRVRMAYYKWTLENRNKFVPHRHKRTNLSSATGNGVRIEDCPEDLAIQGSCEALKVEIDFMKYAANFSYRRDRWYEKAD